MNESSRLVIDVADEQSLVVIDHARIRLAVERVLDESRVRRAEVSVALVDDPTIRDLNRRYLNHDDATDVLSFVLARSAGRLDGQIVASAETARNQAARYGWSPDDELLLYVIHGALHLVGYDDTTPRERAKMRRREKAALGFFGLKPRWTALPARNRRKREDRVS